MEKFNGWIEKFRLESLEMSLPIWINVVLESRYKHISNLRAISDSVVFGHLVSAVLHRDVFNDKLFTAKPKTDTEELQNVGRLIDMLTDAGVGVSCHPSDVIGVDNEKIIWMLLQLSRFYYRGELRGRKRGRRDRAGAGKDAKDSKDFEQFLLNELKTTLKLHNVPGIKLTAISNFKSSWTTVLPLAGLLWTKMPDRVDMGRVAAMTPSERATFCFSLVEEELKIPRALTVEALVTEPEECSLMLYLSMVTTRLNNDPRFHDYNESAEVLRHRAETKEALEQCDELRQKIREMEEANEQIAGMNSRLTGEMYEAQAKQLPFMERIEELQRESEILQEKNDAFKAEVAKLEADRTHVIEQTMIMVNKAEQARQESEDRFKKAVTSSQELAKKFKTMQIKARVQAEEATIKRDTVPAPEGKVTLMFTDIEGSTMQWEKSAENMEKGLQIHNATMRSVLQKFNGYEVKTEGDAFMVAFASSLDAVVAAMTAQKELLKADWPVPMMDSSTSPETAPLYSKDGRLIWRGLRVRMALHTGEPQCKSDPTTGRMDYFGPVVNRAARVEGHAMGGQVVCSPSTYEDVRDSLSRISSGVPEVKELGEFELKGIMETMTIFQIQDPTLMGRVYIKKEKKNIHNFNPESLNKDLEKAVKEGESLLAQLEDLSKQSTQTSTSAHDLTDQLRRLQNRHQAVIQSGTYDPEVARQEVLTVFERVRTLEEGRETVEKGLVEIHQRLDDLHTRLDDMQERLTLSLRRGASSAPAKDAIESAQNLFKAQFSSVEVESKVKDDLISRLREEKTQLQTKIKQLKSQLYNMSVLKVDSSPKLEVVNQENRPVAPPGAALQRRTTMSNFKREASLTLLDTMDDRAKPDDPFRKPPASLGSQGPRRAESAVFESPLVRPPRSLGHQKGAGGAGFTRVSAETSQELDILVPVNTSKRSDRTDLDSSLGSASPTGEHRKERRRSGSRLSMNDLPGLGRSMPTIPTTATSGDDLGDPSPEDVNRSPSGSTSGDKRERSVSPAPKDRFPVLLRDMSLASVADDAGDAYLAASRSEPRRKSHKRRSERPERSERPDGESKHRRRRSSHTPATLGEDMQHRSSPDILSNQMRREALPEITRGSSSPEVPRREVAGKGLNSPIPRERSVSPLVPSELIQKHSPLPGIHGR